MESRKRGLDKIVKNSTVRAHGQSWRMRNVNLDWADPDAPAPSGEKLQDLINVVRDAKPALDPRSRRRRV